MSLEPTSIMIGMLGRVGSMATTRTMLSWSETLRSKTRGNIARIYIQKRERHSDAIKRERRGGAGGGGQGGGRVRGSGGGSGGAEARNRCN